MGAICQVCEKDMKEAEGCIEKKYRMSDGEIVSAYKVGECEWTMDEAVSSCGDCGAKRGHHHHLFCDIERCPKCKGQFITCDCEYHEVWLVQ